MGKPDSDAIQSASPVPAGSAAAWATIGASNAQRSRPRIGDNRAIAIRAVTLAMIARARGAAKVLRCHCPTCSGRGGCRVERSARPDDPDERPTITPDERSGLDRLAGEHQIEALEKVGHSLGLHLEAVTSR